MVDSDTEAAWTTATVEEVAAVAAEEAIEEREKC